MLNKIIPNSISRNAHFIEKIEYFLMTKPFAFKNSGRKSITKPGKLN